MHTYLITIYEKILWFGCNFGTIRDFTGKDMDSSIKSMHAILMCYFTSAILRILHSFDYIVPTLKISILNTLIIWHLSSLILI